MFIILDRSKTKRKRPTDWGEKEREKLKDQPFLFAEAGLWPFGRCAQYMCYWQAITALWTRWKMKGRNCEMKNIEHTAHYTHPTFIHGMEKIQSQPNSSQPTPSWRKTWDN